MRMIPETDSQGPQGGRGESLEKAYVGTGEPDYLHIRDYVAILYRRRWMIAGIIALGVVGAILVNWRATRLYVARATIQIDVDPNILGLDRPVLDQRDWMREFLPTQLGILGSRDLARMAHEELTRAQSALPGLEGRIQIPSVPEILAQRSVDSVKDTRLVTVGFRSTDPLVAATVANALARAYVQRNAKFRSRTTGEASDWLSQQVDAQRKMVEANEAALQRYRQEHGADALFTDRLGTEQQNIVVQKLGELQAAASKARAETIDKEAQYRQLTAIQASHEPLDTLPAIASNSYIQVLKGELTTLERQLGQASGDLGERHPDIIRLQSAVQNAERRLQTETSNVVHAIENDFKAAQARERALTGALARQKAEVQALNGKSVEYTALEREATSNRDVLDKLLQRARETQLARELQSTNIAIVDAAEIPQWPALPRTQRTLMVGLVGSGALALMLVFVLEILNVRITSPADVERHLQIQVLGVTPQVKTQNGHTSLLLSDGAPARFEELFHGVRTNLVMAPGLATVRTVLVTSAEPGEGKTITAANLAISLSRLNQRVLLIDADLRKPQLHDLFGETQEPGLTDALTGGATTAAFRKTKVPRVWLMPAGKASRNPADLLGSERLNKLITLLRRQFDWIVLDSPPVLAVTDPCLIGRAVSGVVFVVGCGQTSPQLARAAVDRLDAAGVNLIGALLNRVQLDQPGESYLPYYHRDYPTYRPQNEGNSWLPELPDVLPSGGDSAGAAPARG